MATTTTQRHPRASRQLLRDLGRIVGKANVLADPADLALYAYDASLDRHPPVVAVLPTSTEQVADIVRLAHRYELPLVARGAGTSLSGGPVPIAGGIVLGLSRLNRILAVDPASHCAVVEPGVTNIALQDALAPLGWVFHPDPASQKVSTIGGNVAENAGGPHCLKYGVTTNHILGVRVVLPDGEVATLGGAAPDAPGYDLHGLLTGSEGTLGIITEITARIWPRPEAIRTLMAVFDSMEAASEAVSAIIAAGVIPASLEMMDSVMIGAVQAFMDAGYPADAAALLLIDVDGLREALEQEAERCAEICLRCGAREVRTATTEDERERLWAGRRGSGSAAARLMRSQLVNDGVVPRSKLVEVLRKTYEIADRHGVRVANTFHAGDGNLHPLILYDDTSQEQWEHAKQASLEILQECIAAGGAISGEHGIGLEKKHAMPLLYRPAELAAHAAIKRAFDPQGRCNPHKILPDDLPAVTPVTARISPRATAVAAPAGLEIDGKRPQGLLLPAHEADVAALLAAAADEGVSVIPTGGGTKLALGMPPQRFDYALSMAKIAGIIEHDAENLSVTVRAGTRLADLQAELAQRGQWVPLDPPHDDATVGGIVATNSYGPVRARYGACRDIVLGLRVALPSGEVISVGGKTAKNVSGYDLPKLFIGSLGTVGVITAATFKLRPLPERIERAVWTFAQWSDARDCAEQLAASELELAAIEVVVGELGGRPGELALLIRADGLPAAVEREMRTAAEICARARGVRLDEPAAPWEQAARSGVLTWRPGAPVCRVAAPPARLVDALVGLRSGEGAPASVFAVSPAIGMARVALEAGDHIAPWISYARALIEGYGGSLVIERGEVGLKIACGVWGRTHPALRVARALKEAFDPRGVLNPRRFVGGL